MHVGIIVNHMIMHTPVRKVCTNTNGCKHVLLRVSSTCSIVLLP